MLDSIQKRIDSVKGQ